MLCLIVLLRCVCLIGSVGGVGCQRITVFCFMRERSVEFGVEYFTHLLEQILYMGISGQDLLYGTQMQSYPRL